MGFVAVTRCPVCSHPFDCATGIEDRNTPHKWDFSICIECAELLVFTDNLGVRSADLNDMKGIDQDQLDLIGKAQYLIKTRA